MLNNDPEYDRLRKLNPYNLIESLPAYREAVERRNNLIRTKVGNISDPSLYKRLAETADEDIPKINKDNYLKAAEDEVHNQREAYAALHKNDYFIIGMYEQYSPKYGKAIFNLSKAGISEDAATFSRVNFGGSIPKNATEYGTEDYDISIMGNFRDNVDFLSVNSLVSPDHYKPDWLQNCTKDDHDDCRSALLVSVSLEQMDAAYTADAQLMGTQFKKLYDEQMSDGGYRSPVGGYFVPYAGKSAEWLNGMINGNITSFLRRQSIWIVGKGDPMDPDNVKVREAYLVVGNQQFVKFK